MEQKEILLEQWKKCVDSAEKWTNSRERNNLLLLTLISLLISSPVSLLSTKYFIPSLVISIISIMVCIYWILSVCNYKKMSDVKWKVITDYLENEFNSKPYTKEWELLKDKKYWKTSKLESFLPICLSLGNLAICIISIISMV
ncbi:MAG: RipA family octameric membrane protein [Metamycoplasmataceae bacterium]